jgi:hypothetical protein
MGKSARWSECVIRLGEEAEPNNSMQGHEALEAVMLLTNEKLRGG